jgi:site-specific DNA-cytosine methylase
MACKTIISLFDHSGNWSSFYKDSGYDVYRFDIKLGIDLLQVSPYELNLENVHGILAAPPCTDFASSGAQYWKAKDLNGRTDHSILLVNKVFEFVDYYKPTWWCLENPVGRLNTLFPHLKKPYYFNPCDYAGYLDDPISDQYTKKTGLWGVFNIPEPKPMPPIKGNSPIMKLGGKSEKTKELRSITPLGFSKAFYLHNP